MKIKIFKIKKSWEPFRICLLNSTANAANFHPNWAWLAVLLSRKILNGSQDIFCLQCNMFCLFFEVRNHWNGCTHFSSLYFHYIFSIDKVPVKRMSVLGYCQFWSLLSAWYNYKLGYKLRDLLRFKCSHSLKYYLLSECCNFNPWKESNQQQVTWF